MQMPNANAQNSGLIVMKRERDRAMTNIKQMKWPWTKVDACFSVKNTPNKKI